MYIFTAYIYTYRYISRCAYIKNKHTISIEHECEYENIYVTYIFTSSFLRYLMQSMLYLKKMEEKYITDGFFFTIVSQNEKNPHILPLAACICLYIP